MVFECWNPVLMVPFWFSMAFKGRGVKTTSVDAMEVTGFTLNRSQSGVIVQQLEEDGLFMTD